MKKYNRIMNDIKDEKQIIKKIEVKEEELKNLDEENKKNIENEIKKIFDEEKKQKKEEGIRKN